MIILYNRSITFLSIRRIGPFRLRLHRFPRDLRAARSPGADESREKQRHCGRRGSPGSQRTSGFIPSGSARWQNGFLQQIMLFLRVRFICARGRFNDARSWSSFDRSSCATNSQSPVDQFCYRKLMEMQFTVVFEKLTVPLILIMADCRGGRQTFRP
jgi:hypothetical protein